MNTVEQHNQEQLNNLSKDVKHVVLFDETQVLIAGATTSAGINVEGYEFIQLMVTIKPPQGTAAASGFVSCLGTLQASNPGFANPTEFNAQLVELPLQNMLQASATSQPPSTVGGQPVASAIPPATYLFKVPVPQLSWLAVRLNAGSTGIYHVEAMLSGKRS